jgi:hypothetical protein
MEEQVITRRRVVRGDDEIVEDTVETTAMPLARAAQVVYFIVGLIEAALALRFLLQILGANRGAAFVDFVYDMTAPLVAPFFGMFGSNPTFAGGSRFEAETLVAMIAYAVLAWIVVSLLRLARR